METFDSIYKTRLVKIDQKPNACINRSQVRKNCRIMNIFEILDGFEFDDNFSVDQQIEAVLARHNILVCNRN